MVHTVILSTLGTVFARISTIPVSHCDGFILLLQLVNLCDLVPADALAALPLSLTPAGQARFYAHFPPRQPLEGNETEGNGLVVAEASAGASSAPAAGTSITHLDASHAAPSGAGCTGAATSLPVQGPSNGDSEGARESHAQAAVAKDVGMHDAVLHDLTSSDAPIDMDSAFEESPLPLSLSSRPSRAKPKGAGASPGDSSGKAAQASVSTCLRVG